MLGAKPNVALKTQLIKNGFYIMKLLLSLQ